MKTGGEFSEARARLSSPAAGLVGLPLPATEICSLGRAGPHRLRCAANLERMT